MISVKFINSNFIKNNADIAITTEFNALFDIDIIEVSDGFGLDITIENNGDNFTDKTLNKRVSIFQKWSFKRKQNRLFTLGSRYYHEDRWGGEMHWTP